MPTYHNKQVTKISGFVKKLYQIVQTPYFEKIICWMHDGKSVKIYSWKDLEAQVLPLVFRHRNYHSFVRQLNMYGFKKQERTSSDKACSFAHPLFRKGNQNQLALIKPISFQKTYQLEEKKFHNNQIRLKKKKEMYKFNGTKEQAEKSLPKFRTGEQNKVNKSLGYYQNEISYEINYENSLNIQNLSPLILNKQHNRNNITDEKQEISQISSIIKIEPLQLQNQKQLLKFPSFENSMIFSCKENKNRKFSSNLDLDNQPNKLTDKHEIARSDLNTQKRRASKKSNDSSSLLIPDQKEYISNTHLQETINPHKFFNIPINEFHTPSYIRPMTYMPTLIPSHPHCLQMIPQQLFSPIPQIRLQPVFYNSMI